MPSVASAATSIVPVLTLHDVSKRFGGVTALRGVSLVVRPGTVHALLGENGAGKSTLMRIAYGLVQPDAGAIEVGGTRLRLSSPAAAIAAGIGMVHQHFALVPAMTVAENLVLGGRGTYSPRDAARRVADVSRLTGFALDPTALVSALPVGAQQRLEIAKSLARHAHVLVLDEPTGVLAPAEVDDLLAWVRRFVAAGHAAVLITHKLREALAVADDVTVLRQGRMVLHGLAAGMSETTITAAMIGGPLTFTPRVPQAMTSGDRPVFDARAMTVADERGTVRVRDATFVIGAGELVGVVGVEGSGQRELLRALAGRLAVTEGALDRPADVGFVPEDRLRDAMLANRPIVENVVLRGAGARRGCVDWAASFARTKTLMAEFDVRASDAGVAMAALSGGNQQKLVLARELSGIVGSTAGGPPERQDAPVAGIGRHRSIADRTTVMPVAIVVESPTRGLDVRASADIHDRLRRAAARGGAVIVYSSDLDEVLALAQRVLVMFNGTVHAMAPDRITVGRAMLGLE
jgi:ABC-type uncharacterized transport system ATPase subunit